MDYGSPPRKLPRVISYLCVWTGPICISESTVAPTIHRNDLCDLPTVLLRANMNLNIHRPAVSRSYLLYSVSERTRQ